ncbi:MAG: TolC family protein [Oligoflexia bacterium]|nr:TolC family protein [Oligoflexia bacterium]
MRLYFFHLFIFLLILILISISISAATLVAEDSNISLSNIQDLIIKNNPDIQLALLDYKLALNDVDASKGDNTNKSNIDPSLSVAMFSKLDTLNSNSTLDNVVTHEKTKGLSMGVTKEFSYGLSMEMSVQGMHITSDSQNAFAPERYQDALLLKTTLPILKNWGYQVKMNQFLISNTKVLRYKEKLNGVIQDKIEEGLNNFHQLIQAQAEIEIQKNILKYYLHLQESISSKYSLGTENNINLLDINARVAKEQSNIIQQENKIYNLKLKLLKLVITNSEQAKYIEQFKIDTNVNKSLSNLNSSCIEMNLNANKKITTNTNTNTNTKIEELKYEIDENELAKIKLKNALYPEINFYVELLSTGLGREHSNSFKTMYQFKYPSVEIGINLTYILENSESQGSFSSSIVKIQNLLTKKNLEIKKLNLDLNKIQNDILTSQKELKSIQARIDNQKEKTTIKESLFKTGTIELSEFLKTIEEDGDLQKNMNQIIIDCQKQITKLNKVTGNILKNI